MHVVFYTRFILDGADNIGIVHTIAMEMPWVASTLISASMPALVRIAKRFATTGVTMRTVNGTSKSGSRAKDITHQLTSFKRNPASAKVSKIDLSENDDASVNPNFRPGQGIYSVSIDATKREAEGASISSNAESHIGILKQADFEVSYEANHEAK
jgi:hypothetical protein